MKITMYDIMQDDTQHPTLICDQEHVYSAEALSSPQEVTAMLNAVFRAEKQCEEHMYEIAINAANEALGVFDVSHGSLLETCADSRGIYTRALLVGAAGLILAHNHPSGGLQPSENDLESCKRLKESGRIMGIKLLDFLVIGKNDAFLSFAREGIL